MRRIYTKGSEESSSWLEEMIKENAIDTMVCEEYNGIETYEKMSDFVEKNGIPKYYLDIAEESTKDMSYECNESINYPIDMLYCDTCYNTKQFKIHAKTRLDVSLGENGFEVKPEFKIEENGFVNDNIDHVREDGAVFECGRCGSKAVYQLFRELMVDHPDGLNEGGLVDLNDPDEVKEYKEYGESCHGMDVDNILKNRDRILKNVQPTDGYVKNRCSFCIARSIGCNNYLDLNSICDQMKMGGLDCYPCPIKKYSPDSLREKIRSLLLSMGDNEFRYMISSPELEKAKELWREYWSQLE